jgi:hypothetical protein
MQEKVSKGEIKPKGSSIYEKGKERLMRDEYGQRT